VPYCNLLGSRVLPEAVAEGSPATVQSLAGHRLARELEAVLGEVRHRGLQQWLAGEASVPQLAPPTQFSHVSSKSGSEKYAARALPQLLLSGKVNIK